MVGEGKLYLGSFLVKKQLVSENQWFLTGVLRGLENLETLAASSFVINSCITPRRTPER